MLTFLLLFTLQSFAQETLQFVPKIENEDALEEGIEFLHCLCEKLNLNWEIGDTITKESYLFLSGGKEKVATLKGKIQGKEVQLKLDKNEAQEKCTSVAKLFSLDLKSPRLEIPTEATSLSSEAWEPEKQTHFPWIATAAVAATLVGGFFLWKKIQAPDYRSLTTH